MNRLLPACIMSSVLTLILASLTQRLNISETITWAHADTAEKASHSAQVANEAKPKSDITSPKLEKLKIENEEAKIAAAKAWAESNLQDAEFKQKEIALKTAWVDYKLQAEILEQKELHKTEVASKNAFEESKRARELADASESLLRELKAKVRIKELYQSAPSYLERMKLEEKKNTAEDELKLSKLESELKSKQGESEPRPSTVESGLKKAQQGEIEIKLSKVESELKHKQGESENSSEAKQ